MASRCAQKIPSRPHESLLPVFVNDQPTAAATTTTPSATTVNIIRCMVAALLIIVIILLSSPTIIFSVVHPQVPIVQLDFFSISNLNASETQISAQWAANITATNPDKRFTVVLEAAKISVFYKGFNNSLSEFSIKDVTLEPNKAATINAAGGIGKDGSVDKNLPYNEMAEAKRSGKMNFEVEMKVVAIQMAFSVWDKRIGLRFSCHDVPVDFFPGGGAGKSIFYRGFPCALSETQQSNVSSLYTLR